jgi:hypothetical protein
MKTLFTALALTAMLATSAVAKTPRTKEVRVQRNNAVSHNAVTRSPTQINSYCRFDRGETDPDRRIVRPGSPPSSRSTSQFTFILVACDYCHAPLLYSCTEWSEGGRHGRARRPPP